MNPSAIPEGARDRLVCGVVRAALSLGAANVILVSVALAVVLAGAIALLRKLVAQPGSASPGPSWTFAALATVATYALGRALDPLLKSRLERPEPFPARDWPRVGYFEWKLLGRPWSWPVLPLEDRPAVGLLVHALVWPVVLVTLYGLLARYYQLHALHWDSRGDELPWYFRWVGASTARRADERFRAWGRRLVAVILPLHALAGYNLVARAASRGGAAPALQCADASGGLPAELSNVDAAVHDALGSIAAPNAPFAFYEAPGAWMVAALLLVVLGMHLYIEGKPPAKKAEDEPAGEPAPPAAPPPDPLQLLSAALQGLAPGAQLVALEQRAAREGRAEALPAGTSPLLAEVLEQITDGRALWSHQREVLEHLTAVWRMSPASARGAAPSLREEVARSPVAQSASVPHALALCAEGAGRTTLTHLAALHVFLDRGATTLAVARDRDAARAWATRLRDALASSSARWNVHVAVAGDDLSTAYMGGRTPAVIAAGIEDLEAEVLSDERSDAVLARLGLVVADDVDAFTGVAEMHLHMSMRRLWTVLDAVHDAPYPAALLATAGPGASGMDAWARHALAAPLRVFEDDGAPCRERWLLRRHDLVDGAGNDIPLARLVEACDAAGIPWHLRLAGDGARAVRRVEFDFARMRRHFRDDPADAVVVLVEGTYPDVRREADRLAHAGSRARDGAVLMVLAPPGDEEVVLHEEATDAAHRDLVASLPRAVTLAAPAVVLQRHFDRALGRPQDARALRERFGEAFVDETLARLVAERKVQQREAWYLDPRTDEPAARVMVAATRRAALGEAIDASCVGESRERVAVVDAGTSEVLARIDRAVARAHYPPGRVFLHPRGRYRVVDAPTSADGATIVADREADPCRTTADEHVAFEPAAPVAWSPRQLGGLAARVAVARGRVREAVVGMRRYAPGPRLIEQRTYERAVLTEYGTEACLMAASLRGRGGDLAPPSRDALAPLVAALRMALPCCMRASSGLVDVEVVDVGGESCVAFYDRTPGGSGFARFVHEQGLGDLLRLARLVLERLVGPEFARLRRIHDQAPGGDPRAWRVHDALAWLDAALDPAPAPPGEAPPDEPERAPGPRVEHVPGEGRAGDLGRLWMSSTGRTDDLVWTRHAFWADGPIGGNATGGDVSLDVAVERRAIARAVAFAVERGASRAPVDVEGADAWGAAHVASLATAATDLAPIAECLRRLAGPRYADAVVALVAAIPTSARRLAPADRAPLAALCRRRADRDAKALLAYALLAGEGGGGAEVLVADEGFGPFVRVATGDGARVWDLDGPRPRAVPADLAAKTRAAPLTGSR